MTVLAATVSASRTVVVTSFTDLGLALRMFPPRAWVVAGLGAVAALLLIGVPTDIIENPFFIRMTPVRPQDYAIWGATALLAGLVAATFASPTPSTSEGKVFSGGLLSYLAVGCPVCNKLVVLLLGTSGAFAYFAPMQVYLGIASLLLLAWTLRVRAGALVGTCRAGE